MSAQLIFPLSMLLLGLISVLVFSRLVNRIVAKRISKQADVNIVAVGLFKAVLFISMGLLMAETGEPFKAVEALLSASHKGWDLVKWLVSYMLLFWGIAMVFMLFNVMVSYVIFLMNHRGKNLSEEIASDRLSSVLYFLGVLFMFALVIKIFLPDVLDLLVPYPPVPGIR